MNYLKEDQFELGFSLPGYYKIAVLGKVPEELSDRLNGMKISHHQCEEKQISILKGMLPDQAALSGVLNTLYDMHITVLSVKRPSRNK
jgi:hypothetical protein